MFDEDSNPAVEELLDKPNAKFTNDDCIGDDNQRQLKKPLFRRSASENHEAKVASECDTMVQDSGNDNRSIVTKDKRNRLSRRSSSLRIQSQESVDQGEKVNTVVTNQVGSYSLRNQTPTKREMETKTRTSKAIQKIIGANEKETNEAKDMSGAINRLLGEIDTMKETSEEGDFSGKYSSGRLKSRGRKIYVKIMFHIKVYAITFFQLQT